MGIREKINDIKEKAAKPADFQLEKIRLAKDIAQSNDAIISELRKIRKILSEINAKQT